MAFIENRTILEQTMNDLEWWETNIDGISRARQDLKNYIVHGIRYTTGQNLVNIYLLETKSSHEVFTIAFEKSGQPKR